MTITLTREEAQQVLDALNKVFDHNDWQSYETAVYLLRTRLSAPQPEYRDVVIKGDLWRIEFLPDHAASVVLVRANYEAQSEPEPVAWNCAADLADASICKSWCGNSNCISHIAPSKPESEYESQPEPEPVAWMYNGNLHEFDPSDWAEGEVIPLYTAPPQRKWQGLTDEEILEEYRQAYGDDGDLTDVYFARAIEAKLKEKNT